MSKAGRTPEGKPYTVKSIIGFTTSWRTLLFTLIFMIQPFGSQPFTAFVFWLKAHNKKGKPPVYTIAQIVSHIPYVRAWWSGDLSLTQLTEPVPDNRQCFHSSVFFDLRLDLRWTSQGPPMACHTILEHDRHCHLHSARSDTSHGTVLASSALVHCFVDRWKYGSFDHGMDG
jgi:hypothetical protein